MSFSSVPIRAVRTARQVLTDARSQPSLRKAVTQLPDSCTLGALAGGTEAQRTQHLCDFARTWECRSTGRRAAGDLG